MRWSWIELDAEALSHNVRTLQRMIGTKSLMAVVKANAYGHDDVWVAWHALTSGAKWLAVATSDEALGLRRAGIRAPILVLGSVPQDDVERVIEAGVTVSVVSPWWIPVLDEAAQRCGRRLVVHLMIDTGMGREGVSFRDGPEAVAEIRDRSRGLILDGIYTHFAAAEDDRAFTMLQVSRLRDVLRNIREFPPWVHAENSAGILFDDFPEANLARSGIALYGLSPGAPGQGRLESRPVLSLKARAVHSKIVGPGDSVGYGRSWIASEDTRVVTLPVGYADGLPRAVAGSGQVLFRGRRWPIIGRVSMDQITVGLPPSEKVELGNVFTLIGRDEDDEITADEVADWCGTIGYEIVSRLSTRLPRIDVGTGMVIL